MGGTANGYHCKEKDIAKAIALARKEGNVGAVQFLDAMKEVLGHTLSVRESDYLTYKIDRKSANDDLTNVLDVLDTYTEMGWIQRTEADGRVTYTATKEGSEKVDKVLANPKGGEEVGMIACTLDIMIRRGDIREDEDGNVHLTEQGMNKG